MNKLQDNRLLRKFHVPSNVLSYEFARNDEHRAYITIFLRHCECCSQNVNLSLEHCQHETILHRKPKLSLKAGASGEGLSEGLPLESLLSARKITSSMC